MSSSTCTVVSLEARVADTLIMVGAMDTSGIPHTHHLQALIDINLTALSSEAKDTAATIVSYQVLLQEETVLEMNCFFKSIVILTSLD